MNGSVIQSCPVCGGKEFELIGVLWPDLIREWDLSEEEVEYINRQQGLVCKKCGNNLRSMALAAAVLHWLRLTGPLMEAARAPRMSHLKVLELNEAGALTPVFAANPSHDLLRYPEVDMTALDLPSESYDLVLHSDTLEHVSNPEKGLTECRRILKPGGACVFTVPVVVGRLSRSRRGRESSYHGSPDFPRPDLKVETEFGADVWAYVLKAGFRSCTMHCAEFPAGLAVAAER